MSQLTRQQVATYLAEAADSFPHEACLTCECFLGYVTRLRLDSDKISRSLFEEYQVGRNDMHSCLGCDPCPPGDLYVKYNRQNRGISLIALDPMGRDNSSELPL